MQQEKMWNLALHRLLLTMPQQINILKYNLRGFLSWAEIGRSKIETLLEAKADIIFVQHLTDVDQV